MKYELIFLIFLFLLYIKQMMNLEEPSLVAMGFEPTPPKRLIPETSALDSKFNIHQKKVFRLFYRKDVDLPFGSLKAIIHSNFRYANPSLTSSLGFELYNYLIIF